LGVSEEELPDVDVEEVESEGGLSEDELPVVEVEEVEPEEEGVGSEEESDGGVGVGVGVGLGVAGTVGTVPETGIKRILSKNIVGEV